MNTLAPILLLPRTSSGTDRICTELHLLDIPSGLCTVTSKLYVLVYRCLHESTQLSLVRYFTSISERHHSAHIFDTSSATRLLFVQRSNTLTISALVHLPLQPRLHGTASRLIFGFPLIVFLHLDGNLKLICSICPFYNK